MMKKIITAIAISLITLTVSAQELGFIGGGQLNYGVINTLDQYATFDSRPGAGFHAGGMFEMNITNRWGFDVAAMYELRSMSWQMGYTSDTTTTFVRQLAYFNLPAHIFVDFPTQNYTFSLFGGPVFTCGLHGTDWAWENTDVQKPVTYQQDYIFGEDGRVVRCEIAGEFGFAFKWNQMQLRVSYQHSFNNCTLDRYDYTLSMEDDDQTYFTQGELKVSFAYLFDLRR